MSKQSISVYLHLENSREPQKVEVPAQGKMEEILDLLKAMLNNFDGEDLHVYLEDAEHHIKADIDITESGVRHKSHIHCHRCKDIKVEIVFNGAAWTYSFPSSTKPDKIIEKSAAHFGISKEETKKLVLKLEDKTEIQDKQPIGAFVNYPHCQIRLYLVSPNPVQG